MHPLREALIAAAGGNFPAVDGRVDVFAPDVDRAHAVCEFTGHAVVLTTCDADELRRRGADGFGGASQPDVLRWLAGVDGTVGSHDVVLVARGIGSPTSSLGERHDLEDHPRVQRARHHRPDTTVHGDERGLVTLGHGLVGRLEMSVELLDAPRNAGAGRELIVAGLGIAPEGELVWAQVAPGNAASLRAFLACGFVPIGSETLIEPAPERLVRRLVSDGLTRPRSD